MGKRISIINAMKTKLAEITDFDSRVYKKIVMPDMVKEYPICMVVPNDAVYSPLSNDYYTAGTSLESTNGFQLSVIVYDKISKDIDDEGLLTDALEDLIEKVVKKILGDVTLGLDYVVNTYLESITPVVDWKSNIGVVEITFQVKYDFEKTNP